MDAIPIDPRDETWEVRAPKYRVYFFDGTASDEFELDARDVLEALAWAEDHRGRRTYALYACVPIAGMGMVLLAGADPNAARHPSERAEPFVSKLVLTSTGDSATLGGVEARNLGSADAPNRADAEDTLAHALAPVLRDVCTSGVPEPGLDGYGWVDDPSVASVMLGGSTGLSVEVEAPEESRVAAAADQVQEWVIEELGSTGTATNWPPCPRHLASHPLQSVVLDGVATWICPADGEQIGPIGSLPAPS
jgi:hypothetical protein